MGPTCGLLPEALGFSSKLPIKPQAWPTEPHAPKTPPFLEWPLEQGSILSVYSSIQSLEDRKIGAETRHKNHNRNPKRTFNSWSHLEVHPFWPRGFLVISCNRGLLYSLHAKPRYYKPIWSWASPSSPWLPDPHCASPNLSLPPVLWNAPVVPQLYCEASTLKLCWWVPSQVRREKVMALAELPK